MLSVDSKERVQEIKNLSIDHIKVTETMKQTAKMRVSGIATESMMKSIGKAMKLRLSKI